MSGDSAQEKTEKATPRKLEKAREKGQIARSSDVAPVFMLATAILYLWLTWDSMMKEIYGMFLLVPQLYAMEFGRALQIGMEKILLHAMVALAIPFAMVMMMAGLVGNLIQTGFVFAVDPVLPDMDKINPASGLKRMFSAKQFVTTLLSLIKTLILALILLWILRTGMKELFHAVEQCDVECQQSIVAWLTRKLIFIILPLLIVMAVLDYLFQRAQFLKEQRMTKEEIKHEMKDAFGDPHVRGARHGIRRELAEQDIQQRIRTARLLIIDMGMAVALHYEPGVTPLPIIVAIGRGMMSQKMVEIATKENVPVASNPSLVQTLVDEGKLDQYIPENTISRVAQLMRQTAAKVKH